MTIKEAIEINRNSFHNTGNLNNLEEQFKAEHIVDILNITIFVAGIIAISVIGSLVMSLVF
jgi:ABC-type arginine transport system permease subunit